MNLIKFAELLLIILKNEIEGEELPEIGIKHLGTFSVKMGTAKFSIKKFRSDIPKR